MNFNDPKKDIVKVESKTPQLFFSLFLEGDDWFTNQMIVDKYS